ncbi:MAG TPA: glycosyltransferase family 1 protein [bacterium]|nr:glycosyltransferase family 1 protein [bacterium]
MIIGIDASRANRSLRTGTEWYSFYIIKHLARLDRKNKYILYLDKEVSPDLQAVIAPYPNFQLRRLHWPWRYFWTLGRLSWEMIVRRPDVLFVPAHSLPLFRPRHTVNTIHDIAFLREGGLYQRRGLRLVSKTGKRFLNLLTRLFTRGRYESSPFDYLVWSTAYALKHARTIIAVSEFTRQEILDVYSQKYAKKIKVVHNGYARELYFVRTDKEERRLILEKYGLEEPFFLYVGRLEKKKNTQALVEAFALFKETNPHSDISLVLIGNAGFGYDEVKYIIEEYNLSRQVLMPGWVAEEDLPIIFSAALAFVFPTLYEGFGIPVLQAMACGVPTLVSDIPVLREILGEAPIYFNPRDKNELAASLATIAGNENLRRDLISRGLARANQFSWEQSARETLKILTER